MPSYDWRRYVDAPWLERFPEWAIGYGQWRDYFGAFQYEPRLPPGWLPPLGAPVLGPEALRCPRIFISHRQSDIDLALRVAWLARKVGFDFWLDVFDPNLQALAALRGLSGFPGLRGFGVAAIIEMALVNSTHVVAVMTPKTRGSQWVPYEYGRVKQAPPLTLQAGCWVHPYLAPAGMPEYLQLGMITFSEGDLTAWFQGEFQQWFQRTGSCAGGSNEAWPGGRTDPLPSGRGVGILGSTLLRMYRNRRDTT